MTGHDRPPEAQAHEAIAQSNPLRRNVSVVLMAALAAGLLFAGLSREELTVVPIETTIPLTTAAPDSDPIADTVVFADGNSVTVDRKQVEELTFLILRHPDFLEMSFDLPSVNRGRTRVTRNLVMSEIAEHASPEPIEPAVFDLVRDEQVQQVLFKLTILDDPNPGSKSYQIIESMKPYVDILAETVVRKGRLDGMEEMLSSVSVFVDGDIGVWDPVAIDVFG